MDEGAWELFCRLYSQRLFGFVSYAMGLDAEKAEEVVQMVLIRCVRSIGSFDPAKGNLFNWLKSIARNEAHTLMREYQRHAAEVPHSAFPPDVIEEILETLDKGELAHEILARRDVQATVREILASLEERQRDVLVMKYMDDLKVAEIAAQMDVSEKAVESLLTRSRNAFRIAFLAKARDEVQEETGTK